MKIKYPGFFLLCNSISNRDADSFNPFGIPRAELKFIENLMSKKMHYIKSTCIKTKQNYLDMLNIAKENICREFLNTIE